jgi:hypothetical protein
MSDFEHELLDLLEKNGQFDPAREEVLRLQITSEHARKKRRLLIWTWVYHAIAVVFAIPGAIMTFGMHDLRTTVQGVALLLIGESLLIVIKLWYVIVHGRLEVMRELKRLELRWTLERREPESAQNNSQDSTK